MIVAPICAALCVVYIVGNGIAALSSIVTNLLGSAFIVGAVAGWITHADETMIWTVVGMGVFFFLTPSIVKGLLWLVMKFTGILLDIMLW